MVGNEAGEMQTSLTGSTRNEFYSRLSSYWKVLSRGAICSKGSLRVLRTDEALPEAKLEVEGVKMRLLQKSR